MCVGPRVLSVGRAVYRGRQKAVLAHNHQWGYKGKLLVGFAHVEEEEWSLCMGVGCGWVCVWVCMGVFVWKDVCIRYRPEPNLLVLLLLPLLLMLLLLMLLLLVPLLLSPVPRPPHPAFVACSTKNWGRPGRIIT